jgi:hypothetical protein
MIRPNKLECLSLETLSSKVLKFEGKTRANPIGAPELLVFPANVMLDWKAIASENTLAYFASLTVTNEKCFITLTPGANVIKLFLSVIYEFSY